MIYIAPAIYRSLSVRTAAALQAAVGLISQYEEVIWQPLWGDAAITRARSLLATKFLKEYKSSDVLVMFDDDIVFNPEDLIKIIEGARETKGIYGGAYMTHSNTPNLTCCLLPGKNPVFKKTLQKNPIEVEYVAAGFMAVHRDVIEGLTTGEYRDADGFHKLHYTTRGAEGNHFYPFFDTMTVEEAPGEFHWLSEDWAFCERARQIGYKCYIDQSIILGHLSEMAIMTDSVIGPSSGTEKVSIGIKGDTFLPKTSILTGDPLIDTLPEDIAEYTGAGLQDVISGISQGTMALATSWDDRRFDVSELDWYKDPKVGLIYALDLASWHLQGGSTPREYTKFLKGNKVLDFGAGIGTFALQASSDGADVVVDEVNPFMRKFLTWRASKYRLSVDINSNHSPEEYDAIVSWHVFEHLEEPEKELQRLKTFLKKGGVLIQQAPFDNDDGMHPMHHGLEEEWEDVLLRNGFIRQEENIYILK